MHRQNGCHTKVRILQQVSCKPFIEGIMLCIFRRELELSKSAQTVSVTVIAVNLPARNHDEDYLDYTNCFFILFSHQESQCLYCRCCTLFRINNNPRHSCI